MYERADVIHTKICKSIIFPELHIIYRFFVTVGKSVYSKRRDMCRTKLNKISVVSLGVVLFDIQNMQLTNLNF